MEYEELENIWKKYDRKLDNLEKINKKIIKETLLKKPRKKLNWHKFHSIYGVIIGPIVLVVALHPNFTDNNLNWKFILGCILCLMVILYISAINIRSYRILNKIDLSKDSVIDSVGKILEFKKLFNNRWKHAFLYYPILCIGVILIAWNSFTFDTNTIVFMILFFVITYSMNIYAPKIYKDRISKLETDILILKEYEE